MIIDAKTRKEIIDEWALLEREIIKKAKELKDDNEPVTFHSAENIIIDNGILFRTEYDKLLKKKRICTQAKLGRDFSLPEETLKQYMETIHSTLEKLKN